MAISSGQNSGEAAQAATRGFEHVPAEMPLAMPEQDFREHPRDFPHRPLNIDQWARRMLVVLLALLPASMAAHDMRRSIGLDGISLWEGVYLALFIPLFAWIAFGFATSLIGFLTLTMGKGPGAQPHRALFATPIRGRTAVLLPVCNEDFLGVMGRLSFMERSLAQVMGHERFEFFILSDSNPANGEIERQAYLEMRKGFSRPVHYRRRALNIGRKPGNIAEWVQRFGGGYDYMIVLDADSVMSGQTMARLALDMERHPHVGLIQTVPTLVGATTFFARWQQFASRLFGPISAAGMIWWAGSEGMFWGHNAILRTKAFAQSCGLPELPGRAPFGGHIMSHDMIEAALLRRRGWDVHMVMVPGKYPACAAHPQDQGAASGQPLPAAGRRIGLLHLPALACADASGAGRRAGWRVAAERDPAIGRPSGADGGAAVRSQIAGDGMGDGRSRPPHRLWRSSPHEPGSHRRHRAFDPDGARQHVDPDDQPVRHIDGPEKQLERPNPRPRRHVDRQRHLAIQISYHAGRPADRAGDQGRNIGWMDHTGSRWLGVCPVSSRAHRPQGSGTQGRTERTIPGG